MFPLVLLTFAEMEPVSLKSTEPMLREQIDLLGLENKSTMPGFTESTIAEAR